MKSQIDNLPLIKLARNIGIQVNIDNSLWVEGQYSNKEITLKHLSYSTWLHELTHAIEDIVFNEQLTAQNYPYNATELTANHAARILCGKFNQPFNIKVPYFLDTATDKKVEDRVNKVLDYIEKNKNEI